MVLVSRSTWSAGERGPVAVLSAAIAGVRMKIDRTVQQRSTQRAIRAYLRGA